MENILSSVLLLVLGTLIGVISWMLKKAYVKLEEHDKELEEIKINCSVCNTKLLDQLMDRLSKMIDEKSDSWWLKSKTT
ncbi:MAG: hypothetical protein Q8M98_05235 [Candidatus Cloacimonadaceae bacterium]|nr:hypothetical protein [Candidatus Cloacimonadaceae bacterium]